LPNAEQAEVPESKIREYLLSESHPAGQPKARFFAGLGYDVDAHAALAEGLRQIASTGALVRTVRSRFGSKYVVDGYLTGSSGSAWIRTVWISETESTRPRFVTAYPLSERLER
jgi:hypothetical protein